jgi:hypothetical protein
MWDPWKLTAPWQLPPRSEESRAQNPDKLMLNIGLFVCAIWFLFTIITGDPF